MAWKVSLATASLGISFIVSFSVAAYAQAQVPQPHVPQPQPSQTQSPQTAPPQDQDPTGAKVWDLPLPTPVAQLPVADFTMPACGTNGGPPSLVLKNFGEFKRCPIDKDTGLREVWFQYDDEDEYIARAHRDPNMVEAYLANAINDEPIILSLLIDDSAMVQGYRITSDPRASANLRQDAVGLAEVFKGFFTYSKWVCTNMPLGPDQNPIRGEFINQNCNVEENGRVAHLESRYFLKKGEAEVDPNAHQLTENQFESSARFQVLTAAAAH